MEGLERTKDEESKKFKSHKINFDFGILIRIKELMVDISSSCMELALKVSLDKINSTMWTYFIVLVEKSSLNYTENIYWILTQEKRNASAKENQDSKPEGRKNESAKILWKAFQFAFRVYTFAGGHDDRADKLTRELANEIETNPNQ